MTGYRWIIDVFFWLGLIMWISALVSAAVAAMNVFPTLDRLPLELERYSDFPVDEHARLAASHIMDGVFFTVDLLQFVAIPLVIIAFVLQVVMHHRRTPSASMILRGLCILIAAAGFAYHATMLAPEMNRELRGRWEAAASGDQERAAAHRAAFEDGHRIAQPLMQFNLLLLVIVAIASAATHEASSNRSSRNIPEIPALARRSP